MDTDKNNFQRLEEEQARQYDAYKQQAIQNNLTQTFGVFKFIGQIIDVYLPAMIGVLVSAVGGDHSKTGDSASTRTPSEGGVHPGRLGPNPPNGDAPAR